MRKETNVPKKGVPKIDVGTVHSEETENTGSWKYNILPNAKLNYVNKICKQKGNSTTRKITS